MPPPLPPKAVGYVLKSPAGPVRVECFLDLICPFSSKMWRAVIEAAPKASDDVCFIIHQVPQPWHAQGSYVHEAALAVRAIAPDKYPAYISAIFAAYDEGKFKDQDTWDKSRAQINAELVELLGTVDKDLQSAVTEKLAMSDGGGNCGNGMTQDMKWITKHHRTRGVHVTPTVFVNGLEAGVVSSGWTAEQWLKFLEPMGADKFQGSLLVS